MTAELRPPVSSNRKRTAARLSQNLEKNLLAYAAAAGAVLLALAQPAAAEVVYTPSNMPMAQPFDGGALTELDINNDGTPDFAFSNYSYFSHGLGAAYLKILPDQTGNAIVGVLVEGQHQVTAAALAGGVEVGPDSDFQSSPSGLVMGGIFVSTIQQDLGSWLKVETAYLGLKFVVDGEVHYGWARVKLVSPGGYASGSISGYAYETVPNQPIVTGQTGGTADGNKQVSQAKPDSARILESGAQTLGMLAMGAPATSVWRSKTTADRLP